MIYHEYSTYHQKTFVKNTKTHNQKPYTSSASCPPLAADPFPQWGCGEKNPDSHHRCWSVLLKASTSGLSDGDQPSYVLLVRRLGKVAIFYLGRQNGWDWFRKFRVPSARKKLVDFFWFPDYSDPVSSSHWLPDTSLKASPETTRKNTAFFSTLLSAWTVPPRWWDIGWSPQYGDPCGDGKPANVRQLFFCGGKASVPRISRNIARGHHPSF